MAREIWNDSMEQPWYQQRLPMEGRYTFLPLRDTQPGLEGSVFNEREWALPGLLAEVVNAFTAPGRSLLDPTFNAPEEAANVALNVGGGGLLASRALPSPAGGVDLAMNAWHGTPHNIKGKFDISKIGTGEGNQAYGEGMYFAEARGTGERYAKDLAKTKFVEKTTGQIVDTRDIPIGKMANLARDYEPLQGNLYKVDIPDEKVPMMLNWDVPLSQQPNVLDNIKKLGAREDLPKGFSQALENALQSPYFDGQDLYYELTKVYANPTDLAKAMQESGFTGIRYLDQQSRPSGIEMRKVNVDGKEMYEVNRGWKDPNNVQFFNNKKEADDYMKQFQTSNFVVFDPSDVRILEKNDVNVEELFNKGLLD